MEYRLPPFKVEANFYGPLAEGVDWSLAAYKIPDAWKQSQGEGIKVAVLDTGCAKHQDLDAAIEASQDFTRSRSGALDVQGHGTHCAGSIGARRNGAGIIGVAPECRLLIGKVLGDDGSGSDAAVAKGIRWAIEMGADIISMSLGGGPSSTIGAAIKEAYKAGRFIICAAGNDGRDNSVNYPAAMAEAIAVGAVDRNGKVAPYSSRGDQVDIAAPGSDILSCAPNGSYVKLTGTSMACPLVAGAVALMLSKHRKQGSTTPIKNNADLLEHLMRTATDAGPKGKDPQYGWGLINPASMLADAAAPKPAPGTPANSVRVIIGGVAYTGNLSPETS